MIIIKKGNQILKVSKNTYKIMFKDLGYEIVDKEKETEQVSPLTIKPDENDKEENKDILVDLTNNLSDKEEKSKSDDSEHSEEEETEKVSEEKEKKEEEDNTQDINDVLSILSNKDNKKIGDKKIK